MPISPVLIPLEVVLGLESASLVSPIVALAISGSAVGVAEGWVYCGFTCVGCVFWGLSGCWSCGNGMDVAAGVVIGVVGGKVGEITIAPGDDAGVVLAVTIGV